MNASVVWNYAGLPGNIFPGPDPRGHKLLATYVHDTGRRTRLSAAGIDGVDLDLLGADLASEHAGDGVNRGLGAGVNRAVRRCDATGNGADVDDAGAFAEVLDGRLRGEQKTEHVNVKCLVELVFGDGLDGSELVYAGVVYEDVESAVVFDGGFDDTLCLGRLGDVASSSLQK
jgi:hypothetical protein